MRILKVHNRYTNFGGEDTVFHAETRLLRSHGHEVIEYLEDNKKIASMAKSSVALQTLWSHPSYQKIKEVLRETKPDVAHFDNIFPLISPSAYYACRELSVPVVQRLHNQRLICPASSFYRKGNLCVECIGKFSPWPGILHACYHDSRLQTAVVASMSTFHHWIGTWQTKVDAFLCSTYFYRDIFTRAGFPSNKIVISPLFTTQKGKLSTAKKIEDYAVFVGRLDPEKGVKTLLEAWCLLNFPLKIRGSGRLDETARDFVRCHRMDHVEFVGRLEEQELSDLIGSARFLIMPSEGYYETFGLVIIEAYSRGVPVIASNIGVAPELVSDRQTGLLFEPGNPQDLADKARWMWNHPAEASTMGKNGLNTYKDRFTPEQCYKTLVEVYKRLINSK